ncbi:thyroid hormone receptor-associated protein 3 isoform X2 [Scleropages formosus]|uniref:thyroid hormone receptor-associated protein 3 isoform X2 n=1 Tax=Scleropages formosus TaxID=113540 RepID=UPI0008781126|nr:thyroid hormone receptor-associated protein 3 isoform X2 [Scleropages formosus]
MESILCRCGVLLGRIESPAVGKLGPSSRRRIRAEMFPIWLVRPPLSTSTHIRDRVPLATASVQCSVSCSPCSHLIPMKKRTGSRSRSRSRSHSPAHNRDRNYPREYQNNREFRGYHRGFRRPYYYRGRGRGYFPRGRYQRGGGGGYNNNYRPNNWQNYRQHPQQQQQQPQHHQHSPRRGRSRSRTPKKRSGSPRSRSRSRYSDRSSSGHSRRSSSSSSRSSSPRRRSGSTKRSNKDVKERSASKEAQQAGGGDGEATEEVIGRESGAPDEGAAPEKTGSNWQGLTDYSSSPKRASPQVRSAVIVSQTASASSHPSPSPKSSSASGSSAAPWQSTSATPSGKSPAEKSPTTIFSGIGFVPKEDHRPGEKTALSTAFKKFLEEHKIKKQASEWENGREKEVISGDTEREKGNGKSGSLLATKAVDYGGKVEKEKYKYGDGFESGPSSSTFMKNSPFLCGEAEEEEEETAPEPRAKLRKEREGEDEPRPKSKATLSTRELFEERFGKWDDTTYFSTTKERVRKEPEATDDLDDIEEELYRSRKQERAAAMAKREAYRGFSPDKAPKARKKERAGSSPSPPPRRSSENRDREMFMVRKDDSPPRVSGKRGAEFSVRMDPFQDDLTSSFGILAHERRISCDLVHPAKKEQKFRSIFQHIQATQLRRSPSELFAQHIVTIVHHIKAQHFPSSGMTLNERFAMYQRAAEMEMMKPRKSPEIHRRIDVSPSAFKKHSHLFEEMKSSRESSYKDDGKKSKSDSMDLRLDIERRKKYSGKEHDHKRDAGRDSGDSPGSSRERSTEKFTKYHKKSKKSKKKRERSRSSSSSSSSSHSHTHAHRAAEYPHEEAEPREEGFNKARLGPRDFGGPMERGRARGGFFRIRGRGWNRGNYPGNHSNGNPPNMGMPPHPKNEDWDPEYTPKSRKYYLHDDREGEGEKKWVDTRGRGRGNFVRGRGRFIFRKTATSSNSSPKWTHDKFQGSGEEGELHDEDSEQDHKEDDKAVGTAGAEQ